MPRRHSKHERKSSHKHSEHNYNILTIERELQELSNITDQLHTRLRALQKFYLHSKYQRDAQVEHMRQRAMLAECKLAELIAQARQQQEQQRRYYQQQQAQQRREPHQRSHRPFQYY